MTAIAPRWAGQDPEELRQHLRDLTRKADDAARAYLWAKGAGQNLKGYQAEVDRIAERRRYIGALLAEVLRNQSEADQCAA